MNAIDQGNVELSNFIDVLSELDLTRKAMAFADKRREELFEYTIAKPVDRRIALRTPLVEEFLQA